MRSRTNIASVGGQDADFYITDCTIYNVQGVDCAGETWVLQRDSIQSVGGVHAY